MKRVLVFGTFDIFHEGHRDFLKQAREHGDFLRVVVARNDSVLKIKNRLPKYTEKERVSEIEKSGLASEVVLGGSTDRYEVVEKFKPDVICLGYDQNQSEVELREKLDEFGLSGTMIVRLKAYHPEKYKSSILRKKYFLF